MDRYRETTVMFIWCDECWMWSTNPHNKRKPPFVIRFRRAMAAPFFKVRRFIGYAICDQLDRVYSWIGRYNEGRPPVEPPPGFVARGDTWADYQKNTP